MDLTIIDNKGKEKGTVLFDEKLVDVKASKAVLHEAVVAHLASQRSGTHSAKTRAEVSGGGIKPWKQKHTGRARAGSTRSPLWRHGGMIFAIKPRDYSQELPRKKRRLAFKMALQQVLKDNILQVVEPIELKEPKTKLVAEIYKKWQAPTESLLVLDKVEGTLARAARNIPQVKLITVESLNTYECLRARRVFITPVALEALSSRVNNN